ncbi:hypothetical protein HPP92_015746 [Vanilla planifolia]|uniref:Uncharacterized protein n=1 Tax=Vanilla planifolia TaxID=51239 RepID=A0A835QDJ5_VANPL|nr:hypothetical protein HPP92_016357 [Vanilla planifolia]KAG0471200.1 hypothetical protein HPP92_015746 [Vanilla planifolia]
MIEKKREHISSSKDVIKMLSFIIRQIKLSFLLSPLKEVLSKSSHEIFIAFLLFFFFYFFKLLNILFVMGAIGPCMLKYFVYITNYFFMKYLFFSLFIVATIVYLSFFCYIIEIDL